MVGKDIASTCSSTMKYGLEQTTFRSSPDYFLKEIYFWTSSLIVEVFICNSNFWFNVVDVIKGVLRTQLTTPLISRRIDFVILFLFPFYFSTFCVSDADIFLEVYYFFHFL